MSLFFTLPKILILFTLIACGNEKRCFTKEEALMACQVEEMSKLQVDAATARMLCEPYYAFEGCYEIK
jgi:hypothetical protein